MNSSLLIPAGFLGIAIATVVGVFFGDSLFDSGTNSDDNSFAINQPVQPDDAHVSVGKSPSVEDFSWDEQPASNNAGAANDLGQLAAKVESVTSKDELAPGDLFGSPDQPSVSKNVTDVDSMMDVKSDNRVAGMDLKTAETQVGSDLNDFFNTAPQAVDVAAAEERSPLRSPAKQELSTWDQAPDLSLFGSSTSGNANSADQSVSAKTSEMADLMVQPRQGNGSSSKTREVATMKSTEMAVDAGMEMTDVGPSVVTSKTEEAASLLDFGVTDAKSNPDRSVVQGGLETVVDDLETVGVANPDAVVEKTLVRKFKITNPKETTLPVTMSVNGEHITLQPDQTYVINDQRDEVNVTFSRGGSFGFKSQKIKIGHYRFSVSRDSGWELSK